ncbi:MAG TPA: ATP-binding cassette domain-containing protein, partial [Acidimicrobiia bacterium]
AYRLARKGIAQAPEGRSVFASLTVEENLLLSLRRSLGRSRAAGGLARAYEMFPPLNQRRRQVAGTLSGGEQRMLALARVLAKPPRLLVCDELSLGLAPIVVDEVYKTLSTIRDAGTTLLIVEQHVGHALGVADDVAVLVKGRVTYDGPVAEMGDLGEWLLPTGESHAPSVNGQ